MKSIGKGLKQDPLVKLIIAEHRLNTLHKTIKKDGKRLDRLALKVDAFFKKYGDYLK